MNKDCFAYRENYCTVLDKLYCKEEQCKFYKQDKNYNNTEAIKVEKIRNKKYIPNKIKYKNYGMLEFTDKEITDLKNGKLRIGRFK